MSYTILRNYVQIVAEEYPQRDWGKWGDFERSNNDHVEDPRELGGDGIDDFPFVLVEHSHYDQTWITLHVDADACAQYHDGQEYAEDWAIERIVDLRTMTEYRTSAVPYVVDAPAAEQFDWPAALIEVYRQWTGPDGYDINIMSDIAALLVEHAGVDPDDVIINGEWPDDEEDDDG